MKHIKKYLTAAIVLALMLVAIPALADELAFGAKGPGRHNITLIAGQHIDAGEVSVWNSTAKLIIQTETSGEWEISEIQIFVGSDPVTTKKGNPIPGKFPYKKEFENPNYIHTLTLDLVEDLGKFLELESVINDDTPPDLATENLQQIQQNFAHFDLIPQSGSYADLMMEKQSL